MGIILCVFLWLGIAANAAAFTLLSGPHEAKLPVSPEAPEVTFHWNGSAPRIDKGGFEDGAYENEDDAAVMEILLSRAAALWTDVKGSYIKLKVIHHEGVGTDSKDKMHSIVVKNNNNISIAAGALPILNADSSEIEDCDIMIGKAKIKAEYLLYAIAHELGHCLGLGHNHTSRNALMGYMRSDRNLYLSNDDKAGLIFLYTDPEFESAYREMIGCGTVGVKSANHNNRSLLWIFLTLPLLIILRRRNGTVVVKPK